MPDEKPLEAFTAALGKELAKQLYPDLKSWAVGARRLGKKLVRKGLRKTFQSPNELLQAIQSNQVKDGTLVTLVCKPSAFGPFLRSHFLPAIIGMHTNLRLGPPLVSENPAMAVISQVSSHLSPVGLYPSVAEGIVQGTLYPPNSEVCGMIGLMPGINNMVPQMPALLASRYRPYFGDPCAVTGVVRLIAPSDFEKTGFTPEDFEIVNQTGSVWFIDATTDESECIPQDIIGSNELWGGLYASGHLEIKDGDLPIADIVEVFHSSFSSEKFEPQVTQNRAKGQEILIFAKGIRAVLGSNFPIYSIHMDAELRKNFQNSREQFDKISNFLLSGIDEVCANRGVDLANAHDLDFSYTNSAKSYKILCSLAANKIHDPLAIVIRDWHRRRGQLD